MLDTSEDEISRYRHLELLISLLELTKITSCLNYDLIRVYVGPESKRYTVRKGLLTQYSWFSKEILYSGSENASQGSINLITERPEVFDLLIPWLYHKTFKAISATDEEVAEEQATLYVDLYLRACVWQMPELQNVVMDRLRARQNCVHELFPRKLINKIYQKTEPQSPLRTYVVDSFIHQSVDWSKDRVKHVLKTLSDADGQEFVLDFGAAMFQLRAKSKIRDPDRKTGCMYHTHKEGEKCGA